MKRVAALDQFRGFAILLMVLANYLNNIESIPAWLHHAKDIGYRWPDLVAPMFIFAMGMSYGLSFHRRRERDGAWEAYQHFLVRFLALLGFGYVITLVWELSGIQPPSVNWGLMQALGAAGLIALPFIHLRPGWRWAIGLGLLAAYQILLDRSWLQEVLVAPHNGPWGALSWGGLLILATAVADIYGDPRRSRWLFPTTSVGLALAGLLLSFVVPLSKHRASASYILLSLGLSALVFYGFHLLWERRHWRLGVLTDWGRNPLLLYVLSYVLLTFFVAPPFLHWYVQAPPWLVVLQICAQVGALSWIGHYLNRRGYYFTL